MARIYVSYKYEDEELAKALATRLEKLEHDVVWDRELPIGSSWREELQRSLLGSDAMLLIWTENTRRSQFVAAEVGAARTEPNLAILPVVFGGAEYPSFVNDLLMESVVDEPDAADLDELAAKLDRSVRDRMDYRRSGWPKVFISHRHDDEAIVHALAVCFEEQFDIDRSDIRCTSVEPYRLEAGTNTSDRLREELARAEVVLGVLTQDTSESTYVMFELGSAWGQRVWTCPLLARGASYPAIPDPIKDLAPLHLSSASDCRRLLRDVGGRTTLEANTRRDEERVARQIEKLVAEASKPPTAADDGEPSGPRPEPQPE